MNAHVPFGNASFTRVAKGLVALHRLIKDGKDDSPEAESVRDALDAPLKALSRVEKDRAQWLSEDLYSISEPPATGNQKEMNRAGSAATERGRGGTTEPGMGPSPLAASAVEGVDLSASVELSQGVYLAGSRES